MRKLKEKQKQRAKKASALFRFVYEFDTKIKLKLNAKRIKKKLNLLWPLILERLSTFNVSIYSFQLDKWKGLNCLEDVHIS